MSDNPKEAEEKMAKAIFISADGWLCVFDLLPASQLGLGIAMISHRFDIYVDEHFKTRKWAFITIPIRRKIGENGTNEMEIVNFRGKSLPIPQIQLPRKVIGFRRINIYYIDRNVIAFLNRFRPLFAACQINLAIDTYYNNRISELILHNIWPMIEKNICGMFLSVRNFYLLRQLAPSILNKCPSLGVVSFYEADFFAEFPCDDSAVASDGQAVAKWLFTALPNNVPKVLRCWSDAKDGNFASKIEDFKTAFASASSPANFIVSISSPSSFVEFVSPFALTNELTREQLALKRTKDIHRILLVRCPIVRDASKWTKLEVEAINWRVHDQWNEIQIQIKEDAIGDGLLDEIPGPSDQQQK
ncbi:hypothetical protein niasHT_022477 [Heterodera trifolii]|uniref:Uncharacterized protein n=1 Tax=Heterodera trifolii TaxID=157864 RepID=A0ABD2JGZ1_9BILA